MQRTAGSGITIGGADKERLIRSSFLFHDADPDLLQRLVRLSRVQQIGKGALLFQQGDEGNALFGVITGLIRIWVAGRGGKELTLGLMEPGDVFGEIALLDGLPRTATAEAAENSALLVVDRALFLELLDQEGRFARHIIELLCERLRLNTDRLSENAFLNLRARLAKRLQALAIAHGRHGADGLRIDHKFTQTELAQMIGVTREAINKQLRAWCEEGVLRFDRGIITVVDQARLSAPNELDPD
ncbi:Crp/Fnr family transcriptional regulator [Rhodospirillaceae bacterium SYSU D60014]|uniref:Crp/Fnr family transcriptional regulator n=1 Tax=Virgifigura deserti TaxID=2268457 RepID=UPI0013C500AE